MGSVNGFDQHLQSFGEQVSDSLKEEFLKWMSWDKNETTRQELLSLGVKDLEKRLLTRLNFGTAGIRGAMGAGFGRMNDLVIIQTSQGLATYAATEFRSDSNKSIVIGYDGRHNSKRFAELTAVAMIAKGFHVFLYSNVCPTPFVSFGVKHTNSFAGIMITASHNPKEDNGYKVYWSNSAQIISPHDKKIQAAIIDNQEPWPSAWDVSSLSDKSKLSDTLNDVWSSYNELLKEKLYDPNLCLTSPLIMTFTPMHGVGQIYMEKAFDVVGLKPFISVAEQKDVDPDFPTVRFPNPEEGKSALNLAIRAAESGGSTLILANDPDSDRLAVAEKRASGIWKVFTGNELGALLGWWMILTRRELGDKSQCYLMSSTVSSKFIKSMAEKEGYAFMETLTGFKWMGNKAYELKSQGCDVCFAYEEAIGFMCGTSVLDKDGISAGVRLAEMANYLANQGLTLEDKLTQLYKYYGYHISSTSYYLCFDPAITEKIFNGIRSRCNPESSESILTLEIPKEISGGCNNSCRNLEIKAIAYRDLTIGYDSEQPDKKPVLPVSKSSQMITFVFDNSLVLTIRASGTEPKIKYYADFRVTCPREEEWPKCKQEVDKLVLAIVEDLVGPYLSEITPQSALGESD
ncbi:unnamed protein product [Allacma fusca]|uniref:Phosphoglucomutase n=1 Tax=Allacma fusca TaxID=39272 RepID=A0A8J2LG80_9HEXA|nr:unnamed protein product [Allacma fusca]